jgi:hypothetical protein
MGQSRVNTSEHGCRRVQPLCKRTVLPPLILGVFIMLMFARQAAADSETVGCR